MNKNNRYKLRIISIITAMTGTLMFFQNCSDQTMSQVKFGKLETSETLPIVDNNGDPIDLPAPPVNCVSGVKLGVWLDSNDDGSAEDEAYLGDFVAYSGVLNAYDNYDYYSASAHPVVGPAPSDFASKVFFYEGPDGISFNFFHNIDAGGSDDNTVHWDIVTSGNDNKDGVILSDDGRELRSLTDPEAGTVKYEARFRYWKNTDGGVIGPFEGNQWSIKVNILNIGDINDASFFSADGQIFSLKDTQQEISSFIIQHQGYEVCD